MVFLLLLFIVTVAGSFFASAVFRRRFEDALPVSIGGIPVLIFFLGLLFGLKTAFFCVLVICVGLLVASFVFLFVKKGFFSLLSCFFTPGFVLYCLLFLGLIYIHYGRPANGFDEFSHWLDSVRAMVTLDDFGTAAGANTIFASYPPGMSVFQYFVQKVGMLVSPGGGFREWLCYLAYQLLAFSFAFPMFRRVTWKTLAPSGIMLGMGILATLSLYPEHAITTCYIDPFLGIVAGCGLALVYSEDRKDLLSDLRLWTILFTLVMAKDAGLFFAVMLAAAMLVDRLIRRQMPKGLRQWLLLGGFAVTTILAFRLPVILWKAHYTGRGVEQRFSQTVDLQVVLDVLLRRDMGWHRQAMDTYAKAYFTMPQAVGSLAISVTYFLMFLLLTLLLIGEYMLGKREVSPADHPRPESGRGRKSAIFFACLSTALYSFGLSVIYLFKFGEGGSMQLLSMDRYLRVPYLVMLVMGMLVFMDWYQEYQGKRFTAFLLACTLLAAITPADKAFGVMSRSSVVQEQQFRAPYDALAATVLSDTEGQPAKVYIVSQGDAGWDFYTLRYCLRPCTTSDGWNLITKGESGEGTRFRTPKEWTEELKDYDYVILFRVDNAFTRDYQECFEEGAKAIQQQRVYRVNKDSGLLE